MWTLHTQCQRDVVVVLMTVMQIEVKITLATVADHGGSCFRHDKGAMSITMPAVWLSIFGEAKSVPKQQHNSDPVTNRTSPHDSLKQRLKPKTTNAVTKRN